MEYYTTQEINENFDREKRTKIARLIWKKPTFINTVISIIRREK